jgi:hypothetical protein
MSQPGTGGRSQALPSRLRSAMPALGWLPSYQKAWPRGNAVEAFPAEGAPANARDAEQR